MQVGDAIHLDLFEDVRHSPGVLSKLGFIENQEQVDLNFLFPDKNEVFADWFTGDIRIPQGKMLKKVNLG